MILEVEFDNGWWTAIVRCDDEIIVRSIKERRLGCAVRNALNTLEHKYHTGATKLTMDLEDW
jgi:hypothetical protein